MRKLPLTRDTVGTVARGHPWVYREGVRGSAAIGELVQLVDDQARNVAFGLFDEGPIAVRVLGRQPEALEPLLKRRLSQALARRRLIDGSGQTNTWRAVNGEGDGLPGLVLDRYDHVWVLRLYSRAWERHLPTLIAMIAAIPEVKTIYRRFGVGRVDDQEGGEVLHGPPPPEALVVQEYGMRLLVRVMQGQKTGLFLDQREHRRMVSGWSSGRTVINLFSYNGGFSVAAALGGAKRVISVDQAAPAIEDARENFRLNGISPDGHGFEAADVFTWKGPAAELVICDPPSLTHRREDDSAARKAYRDLHRHIAPMCRELLATSSCTARLSWERWEEAIREGLKGESAWTALHRSGEPLDHPVGLAHPEGRYLKFLLISRL